MIFYCPIKNNDELTLLAEALERKELRSLPVLIAASMKQLDFIEEITELERLNLLSRLEPLVNEPGSISEAKSEKRQKSYQDSLKTKLKDFRQADDLKWYWQGKEIKDFEIKGEASGLTGIMREVFNRAPVLKYEILTRTPSAGLQKNIRDAVQALLNNELPISIPETTENEAEKIIKAVLVEHQVMEALGDDNYGTRYEIADIVPDSSPFFELWYKLYEMFNNVAVKKKQINLQKVMQEFISPPYGYSEVLLQLLLAAFFRKFPLGIEIYSNYRQGADIGELKSHKLCFQTIRNMLDDLSGWLIVKSAGNLAEHTAYKRIYVLFKGRIDVKENSNMALAACAAIIEWFERIPGYSITGEVTDEAKFFKKVLDAREKITNAADLIGASLPAALGFDREKFNFENNTDEYLKKLKSVKSELEKDYDLIRSAMYAELYTMFKLEQDEDLLNETFIKWYKNISAQYRCAQSLPYQERCFINAYADGAHIDQVIFSSLPEIMGIPPIFEWTDDMSAEVLAWFRQMKSRLEFRCIKDFTEIPTEYEKKNDSLEIFVDDVVKNFGFNDRDKAEILEGVIERLP